MPSEHAWTSIEIRPDEEPTVDFNPVDQTYLVEWRDAGLAVMMSSRELQSFVTSAVIAQGSASTASDASR